MGSQKSVIMHIQGYTIGLNGFHGLLFEYLRSAACEASSECESDLENDCTFPYCQFRRRRLVASVTWNAMRRKIKLRSVQLILLNMSKKGKVGNTCPTSIRTVKPLR